MFVFAQQISIANQYLAELRDQRTQTDRARFRRNLERLGELTAYEISRTMAYQNGTVQTPLAPAATQTLLQQPVLATILRAGLPFHQGFLHVFDQADNAFAGAYRTAHRSNELNDNKPDDNEFDIVMEYLSSPDLSGRTLILIDPMLATGRSLEQVYHALLRFGTPAQTHIAAAIASPEGVRYVREQMPQCRLWLGAIDHHLNDHYYIVPGLGDAGDLAFGGKI